MTSNLLIGYPDVLTRINFSDETHEVTPGIGAAFGNGPKTSIQYIDATNDDFGYNVAITTGPSTEAFDIDYVALLRANLLTRNYVNKFSVRKSAYRLIPSATNRAAWYKATRGITKNSSDVITTLNDLDDTNHLSGTAGWVAPPSGENGNAALSFNGSSQALNRAGVNWHQSKAALSVYWVFKADTVTPNQYLITNTSSSAKRFCQLASSTFNCSVASAGVGTCAVAAATTYVVSMIYDGTATGNANRLKIYFNGVQQSLSFSGTVPATSDSATGLTLGSVAGGGTYYDGELFEFIGYTTAHSDSARQEIEAYLTTEWITAPLYNNTAFDDETFLGPDQEDFLYKFSSRQTIEAFLWLTFGSSLTQPDELPSVYPQTKLFTGKFFDMGRDPTYNGRIFRPIEFNAYRRRTPYEVQLTWEGLTQDQYDEFNTTILSIADFSNFILYTESNHLPLNGHQLLYTRLDDFRRRVKSYNNIDLTTIWHEVI